MVVVVPITAAREQFLILPGNATKEDIKNAIIKRKKFGAKFIGATIALIGILLWAIMITKLPELYQKAGKPFPLTIQIAPIISISLGVLIAFFLQNIMTQYTEYISVNTNEGKIKVTLIANLQEGILSFFILMIAIAIILSIFLLPIYSLTSSI